MSAQGSERIDYWRRQIESSLPSQDMFVGLAYGELKRKLPASEIPETPGIPLDRIAGTDLLHVPSIGAVISPVSAGGNTSFTHLHRVLTMGPNLYEVTPEGSGLNASREALMIRNRRHLVDETFFERLVRNWVRTGGKEDHAMEYVLDHLPISTLWLSEALTDAMLRLQEHIGLDILDDSGRLLPEIAEQALLINADAGAGVMSVHHLEHHGLDLGDTPLDVLAATQTGFLANLIGAARATSLSGACAGSGAAINLAEELADSRKNPAGLFIIASAYDGPIEESQRAFDRIGLPSTNTLPYGYYEPSGYTEAPGASVTILMTRQFAEQYGITMSNSHLIRSVSIQGRSRFGVGKGDVPRVNIEAAVSMLSSYYEPEDLGGFIWATHGVNTPGWMFETSAIEAMQKEVFPGVPMYITSTQPQIGHAYPTRTSISLEMLAKSTDEQVLWGMARFQERVDITGVQAEIQALRRQTWDLIHDTTIVEKVALQDERKARRLWEKLEGLGIHLAYTPVRIPRSVVGITTHTGLGGLGVGTVSMPIAT